MNEWEMTDDEKKSLVRRDIAVELIRASHGPVEVEQIVSDGKKIMDFVYDVKTVEAEPLLDEEVDEEEVE